MSNINLEQLKKLREATSASIADCRRALEKSDGNFEHAMDWLKKHGVEKAQKKEGRETSEGIVDAYIHAGGKVGVLLELQCETDFVARTADFKNLAHELSMQIAAMNPKDVDGLLKQEYIRDPKMTVGDVVKQVIARLGENIKIRRFQRFEIGV